MRVSAERTYPASARYDAGHHSSDPYGRDADGSDMAREAEPGAAAYRPRAVPDRQPDLCFRLCDLDLLHLPLQQLAPAELRLCRLPSLRRLVVQRPLENRLATSS